jgi:Flp pilus assembly protein protease CpaA
VLFLFLLASIPISLADLRYHKIPNIYLALLAIALTPVLVMNGFGPIQRLFISAASLAVLHLCGMGMGDVKLLALIVVYLNISTDLSLVELFGYLLSIAALHSVAIGLKNRKLAKSIPLAPSIFLALALYLATS